jgi:hypothetical protein
MNPGWNQVKKKSSKVLVYLIAGMENVKQGNWTGILVYFSVIILLGIGLIFFERNLVELFYQPSQTTCTFALLIYITFAVFWNGSGFLGIERNNNFFNHEGEISAKGDSIVDQPKHDADGKRMRGEA